jgi:hypothetical protein
MIIGRNRQHHRPSGRARCTSFYAPLHVYLRRHGAAHGDQWLRALTPSSHNGQHAMRSSNSSSSSTELHDDAARGLASDVAMN